MATDWKIPTSYNDPSSTWTSETLAYDNNTTTYAYTTVPKNDWSGYLELNIAAITCDRVRGWFNEGIANVSNFELDVYYGGAWHNIQTGEPVYGQYVEFLIGSAQLISAMRFRFYSTKAGSNGGQCYEAAFGEVVAAYYHGLEVQGVGEMALCDVGSLPLRTRKNGVTYGIELVETSDPYASPVRIKTPSGIKAIRNYS